MTADELERAISLLRRQNTWLRWKAEMKRQARQNKQLAGSVLSPYQGHEGAPEEGQEEKGERPDFAIPELDRILAGTELEVDRLMKVYKLD